MNRTNRNLCVVRDVLKIISDRQKKDKEELHTRLDALSERNDDAVTAEIRDLKNVVSEKTSKPQYKKVTHDLTTKTWYLVGIGTILFFCMSLLTTKIYDQSKEIDELEVAGWKYRALRATLPSNNANVIWLERNVWAGNKDGIQHCQQFVIRSTLVAWLVQELRGLHPSPSSDGNGGKAAGTGRAAADARVRQHQETVKKVVHNYFQKIPPYYYDMEESSYLCKHYLDPDVTVYRVEDMHCSHCEAAVVRAVELESLPILLRTHSLQAREELAERGTVGEVEAVGNLGDAHRRGV